MAQWVNRVNADGTTERVLIEPPQGYDIWGRSIQTPSPTAITLPQLNPNEIPRISTPPITFDPLLSPANILSQGADALKAAQAPVDPTKFIVPGAQELLTKGVNEQLNVARASAQSDFAARGLTGSSTEVQTLTRDLPAAAQTALQEGTIKLLQAAYPLALQEKQTIVDATFKSASLTSQVRQLIGDEQYKQLSLNQQAEISNQDVQLKLNLADIEMKFQAAIKQAEFAFTAAENEKDREVARQQFEYLKSERNKARQGAFISSLTTIAGTIIGAVYGGPVGAAVGASAGKAAGEGFSGLFMTD